MSRGQGRRGSEFGEMSAETPRAFDSPTVDRAVIGGPSQRGAVPGAGVGKWACPSSPPRGSSTVAVNVLRCGSTPTMLLSALMMAASGSNVVGGTARQHPSRGDRRSHQVSTVLGDRAGVDTSNGRQPPPCSGVETSFESDLGTLADRKSRRRGSSGNHQSNTGTSLFIRSSGFDDTLVQCARGRRALWRRPSAGRCGGIGRRAGRGPDPTWSKRCRHRVGRRSCGTRRRPCPDETWGPAPTGSDESSHPPTRAGARSHHRADTARGTTVSTDGHRTRGNGLAGRDDPGQPVPQLIHSCILTRWLISRSHRAPRRRSVTHRDRCTRTAGKSHAGTGG
jgi:hypothetical protein